VNGNCRPDAELFLCESGQVSERRKNQQGNGIEYKNNSDRNGNFFFIGLHHLAYGSDCTPSANGCTDTDEIRNNFIHF